MAAGNSRSSSENLSLRNEWAGFDLVKVGGKVPMVYKRNDLVIVSGCITTTSPMKNQAGWDLTVASVAPPDAPRQSAAFLAPTSMSRYEGIYQCGTSVTIWDGGKITINFHKSTNPMVLHFSGLCWAHNQQDEPVLIPVPKYDTRDWLIQHSRPRPESQMTADDAHRSLEADDHYPPALAKCGGIVLLQGMLKESTYGPVSQLVGTLPEGLRPRREVRWLASLLKKDERVLDHSVAVTIRPDGTITVQGGKVHMADQKGNMRVLQQKKKGCLCLDGIRFSLMNGEPIALATHLCTSSSYGSGAASGMGAGSSGGGMPREGRDRSKISYLMTDGSLQQSTAVCMRQGDVVLLEGHLAWVLVRPPNAKQPLATLPRGHWPSRRETFFTRGGSDLEERRRVDVDIYGRIFCPEGVVDGRVELTGILFVAQPPSETELKPRDPDWDDLKLQYHRNEVSVVSTSFDGHELLEQFVRRSNYHEWQFIEYDFNRHAGRKMLLPLGQAVLRGHEKWDPMNLGTKDHQIWKEYKNAVLEKFGVTSFQTLLHVSDTMFDRIAHEVPLRGEDARYLSDKRARARRAWAKQRQFGFTFSRLQELANQIVDQMFEHWDFRAQLQGALHNDFRAPATIEHLLPARKSGQDFFIRKHIKEADMNKFEEVRQFFYLYETTGSNMTHCSLMGSSDVFTTTGKWYFPDAPHVQKQLFENIAWLFPKGIYLYMSERQTFRFPFIEDLDVQCHPDWQGRQEKPRPPDELLMSRPTRNGSEVYGDPGELMRKRAMAVHMIYPQLDHLEVLVYSASGYNKGKDMLKSSFHLVWPQLIVDPDRAPVIRHVTLGLFAKETKKPGSFLGHLQTRLLQLHESNNWELVFDSTTIHARNGLRLPYNDKASMVIESAEDKKKVDMKLLSKTKAHKKRVREERPSVAVGKIRFEFEKDPETGNDQLSKARWVADKESYKISEWIEQGTCRRDPNNMVELTPWQLGPDVLSMLPTKPGEQFYFEGEVDGEGGHWVTHKPFPNIRRSNLPVKEFMEQFNEHLFEEQEALKEEQQPDLLRRIVGTWVAVSDTQAVWRTVSASQCEVKVPDFLWGQRKMVRPAEVVYLKKKGKVMIDGMRDATDALIRVLKNFTRPDDNAVMPIYDLTKIS